MDGWQSNAGTHSVCLSKPVDDDLLGASTTWPRWGRHRPTCARCGLSSAAT